MRPGLRLQILLLLGGLLLAAFVPLFFAISTYARYTLREVRETTARALGRAIAGQVIEARARRSLVELVPLLDAQVGPRGALAIGVLGEDGRPLAVVGDRGALNAALPIDPRRESVGRLTTSHGRALAIVVPVPGPDSGAVVAVLRADEEAARVEPLVRLSGLYMGLVALALLVLSYFALTRLIVGPLDELSRAARRVAAGARRLEFPPARARELVELGDGIRAMTERLLSEEEALRKKVDEVERATQSLQEAQNRLVRSERLASVGRLAAGLAHEVGNPIAAMIGMQDLLVEGGLDEAEQHDFIVRMRKETERINNILRDLLAFARPAAVSAVAALEPGNVESAVHDTVTLLSPQRAMRDVDLAVDVHPDLPPVAVSSEQLVQVLLNLLLNAADACAARGASSGDACAAGGHVTVRAAPSADGVTLTVEDDGPGVADDVQDHLFEPFVTTKDVGKGTGLGLAVCRGLVEAAGGTINLDRTYQGGARFVVDLPSANGSAGSVS